MNHFADRLNAAIAAHGAPVCVGVDPVASRLPKALRSEVDQGEPASAAMAFAAFIRPMLDRLAPHVPVVKFQSACFERYGHEGAACLEQMIDHARSVGLLVILDAKRGDIGSSAEHYAAGNLVDGPTGPDALTVNTYLGDDSLAPFIDAAARQGKGLFALVRTSNPGSDALQTLKLDDGRLVCHAVAKMVAELGAEQVGQSGYSLLGAVVGATKAADMAELRRMMPQQVFLVPGFGAQGGTADDVVGCFNADGRGALITASRSVNYAFETTGADDWLGAIEAAAVDMKRQLSRVLEARAAAR